MPLKTLPTEADRFGVTVVNAVLTGIVAEKPAGFRYTDPYGVVAGDGADCLYADRDGKPSCLVGVLAARLGIPLPKYDTWDNGQGIRNGAEQIAQYFTEEARARLVTVQSRQDEGETWARAIR